MSGSAVISLKQVHHVVIMAVALGWSRCAPGPVLLQV